MYHYEYQKYFSLNKMAYKDGTVIFGCGKDTELPLAELSETFQLGEKLYNRSVRTLTIQNAIECYDTIIAPISPAKIIVHLGCNDLDFFSSDSKGFIHEYRTLLQHIKKTQPHCKIALVSLKNSEASDVISALNSQIKNLAESEQCEYQNITEPRLWNPVETRNIMSFVTSLGLPSSFQENRSFYDLTKILFYYDASYV